MWDGHQTILSLSWGFLYLYDSVFLVISGPGLWIEDTAGLNLSKILHLPKLQYTCIDFFKIDYVPSKRKLYQNPLDRQAV